MMSAWCVAIVCMNWWVASSSNTEGCYTARGRLAPSLLPLPTDVTSQLTSVARLLMAARSTSLPTYAYSRWSRGATPTSVLASCANLKAASSRQHMPATAVVTAWNPVVGSVSNSHSNTDLPPPPVPPAPPAAAGPPAAAAAAAAAAGLPPPRVRVDSSLSREAYSCVSSRSSRSRMISSLALAESSVLLGPAAEFGASCRVSGALSVVGSGVLKWYRCRLLI